MTRAAIYLRQSLDVQEGIDRQRARCEQLVAAKGWQLTIEYADNDTSASKARGDGTAWARMLAGVGHDFDVIVAVDLDRLLRTTRDLNVLIERGARVVTVDGEIDLTTADGEFRATMLAGIARFEVRRKSERQRRAKSSVAANLSASSIEAASVPGSALAATSRGSSGVRSSGVAPTAVPTTGVPEDSASTVAMPKPS